MLPRPSRVLSRRRETEDTVTLTVAAGHLADLEPGRFNMLYAFGIGEVPVSIAGIRDGAVVHTVRAVGAVTRALCAMRGGDTVGVRGPFGTDWGLGDAEGSDVIVVGGGIGLAPLRGAVESIVAMRERFGRVSILIGARAPDQLLYRREVSAWRARLDLDVQVTVDAAEAGWRGEVGLVTKLIPGAHFDAGDTTALVCGPEVMIRFVSAALLDRGVPPERIRVSLERNMKCAIGHCGHCQFGPAFVCKDGPVFPFERVAHLLGIREV